jgi:metal-responsive CopG/Arc/MetJ family transcriptional regulator
MNLEITIPDHLVATGDKLAKRMGVSRNELFRLAIDQGELEPAADASTLSGLASAVMHSLAVRARAGDSRAVLEMLARSGVEMICGRAAAAPLSRRRKR